MFFIISFCLIVYLFFIYVDADIITSIYHLIRLKFVPQPFKNQTIWVIGCSSGIGEYLIYELVQGGASCIILSARRKEELIRVKDNCQEYIKKNTSCNILIEPLDLETFINNDFEYNKKYIKDLFTTNNLNNLNTVILNAGITQRGLGLNTNIKVIKKLIDINILSIISFTQSLIPIWNEYNNNKSRLLAITSSLAGRIGSPGQSCYSLTKHGINGFFESLRMEVTQYKIDISIICPGHVLINEQSNSGIGEDLSLPSGRKNHLLNNNNNNNHHHHQSKSNYLLHGMRLERCASLYATALYYHITESWISDNPNLLFVLVRQYFPIVIGPLGKIIGPLKVKSIIKNSKLIMDNQKNQNQDLNQNEHKED